MKGKKKKWPFSEELTSGFSLKVSMKMYTSKGCELRGEFESDRVFVTLYVVEVWLIGFFSDDAFKG